MKSPAVVNFAPEKDSVEIRDLEKPDIGPEDVLLEVAKALCADCFLLGFAEDG